MKGNTMAKLKTIDIDTLLDESGNEVLKGRDIRSVGPSDSSDTGADMIGSGVGLDNTSDRNGTGERANAENDAESEVDLAADRIVDAEDAGLGGGLDQAEEAQLGVTDEEIEAAVRERLGLDQD
jgi:hypothetical protein